MKIQDFDSSTNLRGVRFRYPGDGQLYYWYSQWQKGVWAKKDLGSTLVIPLFCEDIKDAREWEVVPE